MYLITQLYPERANVIYFIRFLKMLWRKIVIIKQISSLWWVFYEEKTSKKDIKKRENKLYT